ncbi:TonB-dependent receptor [Blastomonas sp. UPD001]|uniref:TonB-dependent receptor n=1 Tax=Blastomonas sp. UPD001 TaxID=2217673 RepID=UPI0018E54085|nr:TonB-dependent receptor [Blastomonas sp. UPD001]
MIKTNRTRGVKALLLGGCTLAAAWVPAALAQDTLAQEDADGGARAEEIIVTAQRREERLQDVPLSVSVVTSETLRNAAVTTAERLEQLVPGIRMGRSGADLRPAIRGTYTEFVGPNSDPRFGIYIDDIYQSRPSQIPPIVDLTRVEVQKGPQGTLYGRNSYGGNIAFFSANPTDRFEGFVDAIYGRYDRVRLDGAINLPVTEGVAFRLSGMYEKADGYVKNINPLGNDFGDEDQWYIRGALRIAPSGMDDRLEILLRGSYLAQDGAGQGGFGYKVLGTLVDTSLIRPPGGSINVNGINYTFPNGFNGSSFTGQRVPFDPRFRDGVADINGADVGVAVDPDPYRVNFAGKNFRRADTYAFSGVINFDAGLVRLRSITSYTDFKNTRTGNSLLPVQLDFSIIKGAAQTFTQELQILSNDTSSPFQWIAGAFYYDDRVTEINVTNTVRLTPTPYFFFGLEFRPAGSPFSNATFNDFFSAFENRTKSYAGYGQMSYTFDDRLTITGGIRYTQDRKRFMAPINSNFAQGGTGSSFYIFDINQPVDFECGGFIAAAPNSNANAASIANARQFVCGKTNQDFVTYRAAIDYKITPDNLVYASFSTGAHSGGFNQTPVSISGVQTLLTFDPEYVDAYEIGTKNTFMDGKLTLNAAAFFNQFSDLQAQSSIPNPANPLTSVVAQTFNVAKSRAYGVEVEAVIRPHPDWTFNLAFNYLDSKLQDYPLNVFANGGAQNLCGVSTSCVPNSGETNGLQGSPFPNVRTDPNRFVPLLGPDGNQVVVGGVPQFRYVIAGRLRDGTTVSSPEAFQPKYTWQAGVSHRIDLGSAGSLTPEVQAFFSSDYLLSVIAPELGRQDAFTRTDLRLTYKTADERFRLQVFVNNVEDSAVITRTAFAAQRAMLVNYAVPRTWGIAAGFRF